MSAKTPSRRRVSWWPGTRLEWAFFSATAAQALINIGIQVGVLVYYLNWINDVIYQTPSAYTTSLTLAVTSLGCLYQVVLTLDAYRIKNHIQIFVICGANICLSTLTVLQYGELDDAQRDAQVNWTADLIPFAKNDWPYWKHISPLLIICICVSCVCSAVMCLLAFRLHREFSWTLYQHVSPDVKTQWRYMLYQIYLVTLKCTPYFIFSFIIWYSIIDVHFEQPEFSLTLAIIPATLVHLGLAVYCVRHEARIGMAIVLLGHLASMAYAISRLMVLHGHTLRANTSMKTEMTFYLTCALGLSLASFVMGSICFSNFRRGLRPILLGQVQRQPQAEQIEDDYYVQRLNYNIVPLSNREASRFDID